MRYETSGASNALNCYNCHRLISASCKPFFVGYSSSSSSSSSSSYYYYYYYSSVLPSLRHCLPVFDEI